MCVTDCHDMTLAVKVALNLNTTNQPTQYNQPIHERDISKYVHTLHRTMQIIIMQKTESVVRKRHCIYANSILYHNPDF